MADAGTGDVCSPTTADELVTYRYADPELIDEFTFVTEPTILEEGVDPREVVRQRWVCVEEQTQVFLPRAFWCAVCEEDASGWMHTEDDGWFEACAAHGGTNEGWVNV